MWFEAKTTFWPWQGSLPLSNFFKNVCSKQLYLYVRKWMCKTWGTEVLRDYIKNINFMQTKLSHCVWPLPGKKIIRAFHFWKNPGLDLFLNVHFGEFISLSGGRPTSYPAPIYVQGNGTAKGGWRKTRIVRNLNDLNNISKWNQSIYTICLIALNSYLPNN